MNRLPGRWLFCLCCLLAALAQAAPQDEPMPPAVLEVPSRLGALSGALGQQWSVARQSMGEKATDVLTQAMGLLGVPYRKGGTSEETGFDCSGFVRHLYEKSFGLLLPRRAVEQAKATETIERSELQPGDLVFFNTMRKTFSHVGIYMGDGKFIHSPKPGAEVRVEDMGISYWSRRFDGARRVSQSDYQRQP